MNNRDILEILQPVLRPELFDDIKSKLDKCEKMAAKYGKIEAAVKAFNECLNPSSSTATYDSIKSAIETERKIDSMRSNPHSIWEDRNND